MTGVQTCALPICFPVTIFFTMNQRDTDTLLLVMFGWLSFVIVISAINLVVAIVKAIIGA